MKIKSVFAASCMAGEGFLFTRVIWFVVARVFGSLEVVHDEGTLLLVILVLSR